MAGQRSVGRTTSSVTSSTDEQPSPPRQDELRAVAERVREAFPRPFTSTELVLIDVDPATLHAFWTIPLTVARRARRTLGAAQTMVPLLLRVRALGEDGQSVTATVDVDVVGLQSQTYVTITRPERFYAADIGVVGRSGVFQALVTSNTARLPRLPRGRPNSADRPAIVDVPVTAPAATPTDTPVVAKASAAPLAMPFPPPPDRPGGYDPGLEQGAPSLDGAAPPENGAPPSPTGAAPVPGGVATGHPAAEPWATAGSQPGAPAGSPPGPRDRGTPLPFVAPFPLPPSEPGAYDPLPFGQGDFTEDNEAGKCQASEGETAAGSPGRAPFQGTPTPFIAPFPPPPSEAGIYDPHPYGPPDGPADHASAGEAEIVAEAHGDATGHGMTPDGDAADEAADEAEDGWSGADAEEWSPSSAVFSAFGAADAQPAIGDVQIEVEMFGRARPKHHLFLLGRRVALRPDGTFSHTHRLASDDAVIAMFLDHGGAAPVTSVMSGSAAAPAAGADGGEASESEDGRTLALGDLDDDETHEVELEVNAILRVSGRTAGDGDIHVLGRAVTPDAEGRFSVGYPLPHGALFISALLTAPENGPERRNDGDKG